MKYPLLITDLASSKRVRKARKAYVKAEMESQRTKDKRRYGEITATASQKTKLQA